jgi:hypothetical protein
MTASDFIGVRGYILKHTYIPTEAGEKG